MVMVIMKPWHPVGVTKGEEKRVSWVVGMVVMVQKCMFWLLTSCADDCDNDNNTDTTIGTSNGAN
eukprot:495784-Ditylum_brightwellii.AAC.1